MSKLTNQGTWLVATQGVEHYTRLPQHTSLRLTTNKFNRLEPGMTIKHTQLTARPQAALAQAEGA